jgi:hypothetical protein
LVPVQILKHRAYGNYEANADPSKASFLRHAQPFFQAVLAQDGTDKVPGTFREEIFSAVNKVLCGCWDMIKNLAADDEGYQENMRSKNRIFLISILETTQ